MIKEIVKDTFLLSRRCEAATLDDLQTVQICRIHCRHMRIIVSGWQQI